MLSASGSRNGTLATRPIPNATLWVIAPMGSGKTYFVEHAQSLRIATTDGEQYARGPFSTEDRKRILHDLASLAVRGGRPLWPLRSAVLYAQLTLASQFDAQRYDIYLCHSLENIQMLHAGQLPRYIARMLSPLDVHLQRVRERGQRAGKDSKDIEFDVKLATMNHSDVAGLIYPFALDVTADDEGKEELSRFAMARRKAPLSLIAPETLWAYAERYIDEQEREQEAGDQSRNAGDADRGARDQEGDGQQAQVTEEGTEAIGDGDAR